MMSAIKSLVAKAYLQTRPGLYQVQFAGRQVSFLTDEAYSKTWYYRNRLKGAVGGYHEPALTLFLENLSASKKCLLDVGAHLGYFSLLFASVPRNQAIAIELDPSNFRELARAIDAQPEEIRSRITAYNVGISDAAASLEVPRSRPMDSSRRIQSSPGQQSDTVPVELITIDALLERTSFVPDLVKIDVEGHEVHALRGARRLLEREHPLLLIEVHPAGLEQAGATVSELFDMTAAAGYRNFRFVEHRALGGSRLTEAVPTTGDTNWDMVCVHGSDDHGLAAVGAFLA